MRRHDDEPAEKSPRFATPRSQADEDETIALPQQAQHFDISDGEDALDATDEGDNTMYEDDDVKQKSQLSRDKCRMGTSRAESMVSSLDDARSEVSSVTTGYCHSSLEAALAAVRGTRRE